MTEQARQTDELADDEGSGSPPPVGTPTPMMAQYLEIKALNAGYLLFYRMGDFYELFFDDAEIASRALGITLTKRGQHLGKDIPMCGVPVHAADDYLQKLIALGHRVAVCEQLEDPAEAKKRGSKAVVRRDVTRLVTPATITEDTLLEPGENAYLLALARIRASAEMAYSLIDISTGEFRLGRTSPEQLLPDLTRIAPSEIVVPEPLFHDPDSRPVFDQFGRAASPQPASTFDSTTAPDRLARYFGVSTLDGFGDFSRAELAAAAGALAYVDKTQVAERPALQRPQRESAADTMFIDPATRTSLELERTLSGQRDGSLLTAIDRTVTPPGARLLAARLRAPLTDPVVINARLDSVGLFVADDLLARNLRAHLKATPDMARALSRLSLNRAGPRDLLAVRDGMDVAAQVLDHLAAEELPAELANARTALSAMPAAVTSALAAALADEVPLIARDGGFVRAGHHQELDEMRALRDESRRIIASLQADYAAETGIKSLKIKHNNVLGYFIEVTALNAGVLTGTEEAKARFIHRQTMANAMRFTTTELADLESRIADAAGRALDIELAVFEELRALCVAHADPIRESAYALAVFDVSASLAELATSQAYCRPVVDDSRAFQIVAGRHAVVEQALRRQAADPFVANDCDLSPKENSSHGALWLLTGPNMGGKSTFLRQNALIAILAQIGSYVPAGQAHVGIVDRLFSRVGASDDLARGRSTFMVEMVETAAILNQAGANALVILDEIGRGTATFDGLSIAWATIEYLHEQNRCRTIFATHFHELTALHEKLDRLANVTMRVKEWEGEVVFLHEVGHGAADRSYGVQVARLAGLPEAVVGRARAVLDQLETQNRDKGTASLIDDLPLFSAAPPRNQAVPKSAQSAIESALGEMSPDEMTPRQALDALYALRALVGNKD